MYVDPVAFETLVVKSHNEGIRVYCEDKRGEIRAATSRAVRTLNAQQQRAISEALDAFSKSFEESSAAAGGQSTTKCFGSDDSIRCYTK